MNAVAPLKQLAARRQRRVDIVSLQAGALSARDDPVVVEEALQIQVAGAAPVITMRTPGHDCELAAGWLLGEGIIQRVDDIERMAHRRGRPHELCVVLKRCGATQAQRLQRAAPANSACGVCGKSQLNLESLQGLAPLSPGPRVDAELLCSLPQRLRARQELFAHTGGLHAEALFDATGKLLALREDVGRHNALDKLNGWALFSGQLPLAQRIVVLSGRASFELMQKCIVARVPLVCAISAPSSYAVSLARRHGVTLIGFLREGRCNIYSAPERIRGADALAVPGLSQPA